MFPSVSHFSYKDFDHVYEPSEDSYLFVDSLYLEKDFLQALKPSICVEIGPGSGVIITSLATIIGKNSFYIAADINDLACKATKRTAKANDVSINCITCDLLKGCRFNGLIDILLFNPPYVPTPSDEVGSKGIEAAWAGGEDGREVIDKLLPFIDKLLSPKGVFYMVVVEENKPDEIIEFLKRKFSLKGIRISTIRAKNELLSDAGVWVFNGGSVLLGSFMFAHPFYSV